MSFAGVVIACWLGIAGVAFLAISGLGRLAARGDVDADLAIVGDAELRMLLGDRGERLPRDTRAAHLWAPSARMVWTNPNHDGAAFGRSRLTT
jgi:hypothetical protein